MHQSLEKMLRQRCKREVQRATCFSGDMQNKVGSQDWEASFLVSVAWTTTSDSSEFLSFPEGSPEFFRVPQSFSEFLRFLWGLALHI